MLHVELRVRGMRMLCNKYIHVCIVLLVNVPPARFPPFLPDLRIGVLERERERERKQKEYNVCLLVDSVRIASGYKPGIWSCIRISPAGWSFALLLSHVVQLLQSLSCVLLDALVQLPNTNARVL